MSLYEVAVKMTDLSSSFQKSFHDDVTHDLIRMDENPDKWYMWLVYENGTRCYPLYSEDPYRLVQNVNWSFWFWKFYERNKIPFQAHIVHPDKGYFVRFTNEDTFLESLLILAGMPDYPQGAVRLFSGK